MWSFCYQQTACWTFYWGIFVDLLVICIANTGLVQETTHKIMSDVVVFIMKAGKASEQDERWRVALQKVKEKGNETASYSFCLKHLKSDQKR